MTLFIASLLTLLSNLFWIPARSHVYASSELHGSNGQNATPCRNIALDVKVISTCHAVSRFLAWFWGKVYFDVKFTNEHSVESEKCNLTLQYADVSAEAQIPNEPLEFTSELIEYKTFLRENMKDSSWAKSIRKTYDAIDSNAYTNKAYAIADFAMELNYACGVPFEQPNHQ